MHTQRRQRREFAGQIIDVHSHVGFHARMYRNLDYPCSQTVEDLYYRQQAGGIDVNVVFPFGSYPGSDFPYHIDNQRVLREVYDFCSDLSARFLPFLCVDPGRKVAQQLAALTDLAAKYPIYGIKINPVDRRTPVRALLRGGCPVLEWAASRNLPLLFHAVPAGLDAYSAAEDILDLAERFPAQRFCLAHALLFRKDLLDRAAALPNAWVDTAALKIQLDLARELVRDGRLDAARLVSTDLADCRGMMRRLAAMYPDTLLWGTDSPAYTFHTVRQQGDGEHFDFHLKGRYEDEVGALRALGVEEMRRVANGNTLNFLFGEALTQPLGRDAGRGGPACNAV